MSAPSANSHSWYATKNEGPGQQGFAHNSHLYNRTPHHVGPARDQAWLQHQSQDPRYNWYTPASSSPLNASHPLNSDIGTGDCWNWGNGANYQQQPMQYGQPYQQNTQQYSVPYRNPNVLPVARPNPDPWNWGWEESGASANSESLSNSTSSSSNNNKNKNNNNNNVCPDPVWSWSVDSTATHQEHVPSTNAGYSSAQHGQNYTIAPTHVSVSSGSVATVMTPSTAALIAESFSSGSADQTPLFSIGSSQNLAGNKNPLTLNFVRNNNISHPVVNSGNKYTAVSTPSHFNQDVNNSHGSHGAKSDFEQGYVNNISQQVNYTAGVSEETLRESHVVTQEVKNVGTIEQDAPHPSLDCVRRGEEFSDVPICKSVTKTEKSIKKELDSPANDVPELSRGSSSREQDISKQSFSTGDRKSVV